MCCFLWGNSFQVTLSWYSAGSHIRINIAAHTLTPKLHWQHQIFFSSAQSVRVSNHSTHKEDIKVVQRAASCINYWPQTATRHHLLEAEHCQQIAEKTLFHIWWFITLWLFTCRPWRLFKWVYINAIVLIIVTIMQTLIRLLYSNEVHPYTHHWPFTNVPAEFRQAELHSRLEGQTSLDQWHDLFQPEDGMHVTSPCAGVTMVTPIWMANKHKSASAIMHLHEKNLSLSTGSTRNCQICQLQIFETDLHWRQAFIPNFLG